MMLTSQATQADTPARIASRRAVDQAPRTARPLAGGRARHLTGRVTRRPLLVGLLALTMVAMPETVHAQTIRQVLRDLQKAARADTGATVGAVSGGTGSGGASAAASGSRVRIQSVRFESADTISASFTADTGVTRRLAAVPCGPKRACAPGWDLRVVRVTAPRGPVPTAGRFSVIVDVDNHGRVASPASELRVCTSFGDARCSSARGESVGVIDVPTLAPGETIRFAHVVLLTAPNETDGWSVVAQIDPDGTSGEVNQANNAGRSTPIATQLPALEWLAFEVPSVARAGTALPLTVRIRNKSVAATSAPVEVQFYGAVDRCPRAGMAPYTWGHDGPHRLMVPAIGPRQVVVLTLAVTDALACGLGEASITAVVDPDATRKWSASTEREIGRQFSVQ